MAARAHRRDEDPSGAAVPAPTRQKPASRAAATTVRDRATIARDRATTATDGIRATTAAAGGRSAATRRAGATAVAARRAPVLPERSVPEQVDAGAGLTFHEKMSGYFAMGYADPHEGARAGRRTRWRLTLRATVTIADIDAFVADPLHHGTLRGEVELPGVEHRIPFHDGVFRLFAPSGRPDLTLLVYEAPFSYGGQAYYLAGRKNVRDDLGLDLWPDTTTLDVRLHRGPDVGGEVVGAGVLRLGGADLVALLLSMRATNVASPVEAARVLGTFGLLFARSLRNSYLQWLRAFILKEGR
ncbi:hypothetical protein OG884_04220 [Streptosporangium sp. NBC_01755]|uniref:hypothetical protein n=1 Tax=unclassified Streptosporangium TaxID=2632669 RepID=UPI002DD9FFFD|nr:MULTISPECIES: hypothetical protein [unclassified Streptosporangium]WSA27296.1 hypothetical protein OIE13_05315 [Streptosporangium sp. NBC_01810]WSD01152.1 hypothetical protein OG884_04220 [Streptosporangium sp. NBC_01755]